MLQLKEITKEYYLASETVSALRGVSISFRKQEFVSILGPSGCGKTTLLNIVGGLDHYTNGDLLIGGKSTKSFSDKDWDVYRNHRIGFIFQSYNLIPHQTVLGNVELALTIAGCPKEERVRRAKEALDRVGLAGKYNKRPNQLSGGQCQRVAIARALVNDPEILLADEPTGALDTVTSVQIMDLIREISRERLVIMVTHNPDLAEKYSSRIVRLLDGAVVEDSNPFSAEEEVEECKQLSAKQEEEKKEAEELAVKAGKRLSKNRDKEKAKMSLFTAIRLSARNLWSKRGRTAMVGFAGSIGIIGIALVLAFSAGIKGYVASMQDDLLSGYPIEINKTGYDLAALTDLMKKETEETIEKTPYRVYVNSTIEYIAKMAKQSEKVSVSNEITEDYESFLAAMPKDAYAAMLFDYGIDLTRCIYTDFQDTKNETAQSLSIHRLTNVYNSILSKTDYASYANYLTILVPSFEQAPNNTEYISSQYSLLAGSMAKEKDEIMLVLNADEEISDLLLARLGYYSQDEFLAIIDHVNEKGDSSLYRDSFSYDELIGKTFRLYLNDDIFAVNDKSVTYHSAENEIDDSNGALTLKVTGILRPNENISFGCLSSGVYYTEALTDYVLSGNENSEITTLLQEKTTATSLTWDNYTYSFTYQGTTETGSGNLGTRNTSPAFTMNIDEQRESFIASLGGCKVAQSIKIYPLSFADKDVVTDYLDSWNSDESLSIGDKTIAKADRSDVKYTDTMELIVTLINTLINVVSYALIAFTSVSLVVSTIMIGIITYVSVVERIKEIGVIRSLGGRKRDVSHLFNAEAMMIGSLAGVFGIAATYLVSAVVNAVLYPLIQVPNIAALPVSQAIMLILLSVALTAVSGLIPARSAAKKDPVVALRTE